MKPLHDFPDPDLEQLVSMVDASDDILERLAALRELSAGVAAAVVRTVAEARHTHLGWPAIAEHVGMTRQGARQRYLSVLEPAEESDSDDGSSGEASPGSSVASAQVSGQSHKHHLAHVHVDPVERVSVKLPFGPSLRIEIARRSDRKRARDHLPGRP